MSHKCKCGGTLPEGFAPYELCHRCKTGMLARIGRRFNKYLNDNKRLIREQQEIIINGHTIPQSPKKSYQ